MNKCRYFITDILPHRQKAFLQAFLQLIAIFALTSSSHAETSQQSTVLSNNSTTSTPTIQLSSVPNWISSDGHGVASIVWGDIDNDGDMDLIAAEGYYLKIHLNENGLLPTFPTWRSEYINSPIYSLVLGDVDNDGDLDLAAGSSGPNTIYLNNNSQFLQSPIQFSNDNEDTLSVAWGDVNGDGDLDLAVGNTNGSKVYLNDGKMLKAQATWTSDSNDRAESVAWGDINNDGLLDLAVGNYDARSKIYVNHNGMLKNTADWVSKDPEYTKSVAWGDIDGDGDIDIAFANSSDTKVYFNNNGSLTLQATLSGATGVAFGDLDNDGDLDLVSAATSINDYTGEMRVNKAYTNNNGTLSIVDIWASENIGLGSSIALGDYDNDGDLDLATSSGSGSLIYRNHQNILKTKKIWTSDYTEDNSRSMAWGDVDNDGDLDLAVGKDGRNILYQNNGITLETTPIWFSDDVADTRSVAWGDVNNDGYLDLAAGNTFKPSQLYLNKGGKLSTTPIQLFEDDRTEALAWGDADLDGDLDLAATGNSTRLYLNKSGLLQKQPILLDEFYLSSSVTWGDVDQDGDLDIAIGGYGGSTLFLNTITADNRTQFQRIWNSQGEEFTQHVALGDVEGDGYLDLALGNRGVNTLYLNHNGNFATSPSWHSIDTFETQSIAWGDADGDGDLDLIAGNFGDGLNTLYVNEQDILQSDLKDIYNYPCSVPTPCTNFTETTAWGDMDMDGDLDLALAVGGWHPDQVLINQQNIQSIYHNQNLAIALDTQTSITNAGSTNTALASANFYALADIHEGIVPIHYWLFQNHNQPARQIVAYYSLDGGGKWLRAVPTPSTQLTNLATQPYPTRSNSNHHVFYWDVTASGFLGQSDNVVIRLVALPNQKPITNSVPGPFQYAATSAQTYPFRVRGTQIRVINDRGIPQQDALVYRLPADNPIVSHLISNSTTPFRTTAQGYLQGRGSLFKGDKLLALVPITKTNSSTLYYSSASPTLNGLNSYTVIGSGVQTLTISQANPLLLFDLSVSLEWDASNDPTYLQKLQSDLIETAKSLYDWSNGQVSLGNITVYQAREHWDQANIQIMASNLIRPSANRGGIVDKTWILTDTRLNKPIIATPGVIRVGQGWTRYGNDDPSYINDWQHVLAHELSHYLLFLEDSYLGKDQSSNLLIPIETCRGTAMTDPYEEEGSEFRINDGSWLTECGKTLSELPDWELIRLAYPALHAPPPLNPGPQTMPFVFTKIEIKPAPASASLPLINTQITLGNAANDLFNGRVYLIRQNQQLTDLGVYRGNELHLRGAHDGDELCIFTDDNYSCSNLKNNSLSNFAVHPRWLPTIALTPTGTTSLVVYVDTSINTPAKMTVYSGGASPQSFSIIPGSNQTIILNQPAVEVLVDVIGNGAGQRLITGYSIGSGPGRLRSFDGPVTGIDGDVVIYPPSNVPENVFISLQIAEKLPPLPVGITPIGRAYYVRPSITIVDYADGSIAFQYLGHELTQRAMTEEQLAIYYWTGSIWKRLPTILNTTQNFASAKLENSGLYMIAGYHMSLQGPDFNVISYPLLYSQAVTQALAPISGYYNVVYHYDPTATANANWTAYGTGVPEWANSLYEFRPNNTYWIYANQNIIWTVQPLNASASPEMLQAYPPAIFYGSLSENENFASAIGMTVNAFVNGANCGETKTREYNGAIIFVIAVAAIDPQTAKCGVMGQTVTFTVDGRPLEIKGRWNNTYMQSLYPFQVYLPIVTKK